MCLVSVVDQGAGIPEKNIPFLFDKLYRVNPNLGEGLGLGLYITKKIIEAYRGKIWVKSKLGQGSKFEFTLPILLNHGEKTKIFTAQKNVAETTEFSHIYRCILVSREGGKQYVARSIS